MLKICSNLIKVAGDGAYSDEFLPYVKGKLPFWISLFPLTLRASAKRALLGYLTPILGWSPYHTVHLSL